MTGRLSTIITTCKECLYRRWPLRYCSYLAAALALLLYWLFFGGGEVDFVYNAF